MKRGLTDDHGGELEALLDRLSVDLVGQICKPNEAGQVWVRLGTGAAYTGEMGWCSRMEFSANGGGDAGTARSNWLFTVFRHCCCCRRRGRE